MMIELSQSEIGTIKCALARYNEFCDNCVSAFSGTGHDEYYKGRKEEIEKLQEKIYTITLNAENGNDER